MIRINSLTKRYKNFYAVKNLSLHIERGEIYGFLGNNGAGKTTTIKALLGLIIPTSGEIYYNNEKFRQSNLSFLKRVGSLVEVPGFYGNLSGYENLRIFSKLKGIHKKNALSEAFGYVKLDINDKKPVSKYSLGMKQRLGIARTLINEPEVLILDEPVNGLDPSGIREMRSLFKRLSVEKNITIFFSSHILSEVELLADRVGIIDNGSILEEVNLKKLKSENNSYFDLTVSDSSKACKILETELDIFDYSILNDKDIRIHDIDHDISIINKTLIYNDVMVYRLNKDSKSLESYFLNVVRREK